MCKKNKSKNEKPESAKATIWKKRKASDPDLGAWENCEGDPQKAGSLVIGKHGGTIDPVGLQVGYTYKNDNNKYD